MKSSDPSSVHNNHPGQFSYILRELTDVAVQEIGNTSVFLMARQKYELIWPITNTVGTLIYHWLWRTVSAMEITSANAARARSAEPPKAPPRSGDHPSGEASKMALSSFSGGFSE